MSKGSSLRTTFAVFVSAIALLACVFGNATFARAASNSPMREGKWIEVVLADQRLNAWEDGRIVMTTPISSGVRTHPTVRGTFKIYAKYARTRMTGPGYDLPNVPYVMYFSGSFGLGPPKTARLVKRLPVQVAQLDRVSIANTDRSNAGCRQIK